ncbi:response regulator, partial [Streptomyces sp. A108]|nr:response regulator [Streptomyces sp. A108]
PGPPQDTAPPRTTAPARDAEPVRSGGSGGTEDERRRRRAQFLRDLAEARELRDRVQPRRAKVARLRHAMRMRTFRW